jgi:geranylgeranyl pyrophosphate synthase
MLKLFKKYNTIELSLEKAHDLIADAKNELAVFPDSPAKEALHVIADYTLQRRK